MVSKIPFFFLLYSIVDEIYDLIIHVIFTLFSTLIKKYFFSKQVANYFWNFYWVEIGIQNFPLFFIYENLRL